MRYLGIDYGRKNVGLATSDEGGRVAFPLAVINNDASFLTRLKEVMEKERVDVIVVGESKDFFGEDNSIMNEARDFAERLRLETGRPIFWESEFLTSRQAERVAGKNDAGNDARAAAIILQSYLDRQNGL